MANSTASIFIKPIVAFNRGDTFVFGSWVCTADHDTQPEDRARDTS
jgi:hypothetical protein